MLEYFKILKGFISSASIIALLILVVFMYIKKINTSKINMYFLLSLSSILLMIFPIYSYNNLYIDLRIIPIIIGYLLFGSKLSILISIPSLLTSIFIPNFTINILANICIPLVFSFFYKNIINFNNGIYIFDTVTNKQLYILFIALISQNSIFFFTGLKCDRFIILNLIYVFICFQCLILIKSISKNQISFSNYKSDLEKKVFEDPLTAAKNYRYLSQSIFSFIETNQSFSLIFIDVDYFKNFNDKNGHMLANNALIKLSNLLMNTVRNDDIVARYGGEEFIVLLKNCSKPNAIEIAEKIRKSITKTYFKGQENQPFGILTISCGVSNFPSDGDSLENLIDYADKGLYTAKKLGRNRVECM